MSDREDVGRALAIAASSTLEDRTIDITTTGRRSFPTAGVVPVPPHGLAKIR
jgi:hypothetical protein